MRFNTPVDELTVRPIKNGMMSRQKVIKLFYYQHTVAVAAAALTSAVSNGQYVAEQWGERSKRCVLARKTLEAST